MTWPTDERRTEAVQQAMEMVPVSRRKLARRADLSHTTLNRIASGEQVASLGILLDVYGAIKEMREACDEAMQILLDADDFSDTLEAEDE